MSGEAGGREMRRLLSGGRTRFAPWIGPLLALAIAGLLIISSAQANHIARAIYTGTHSGGGTVEFTVSADGRQIDSFRFTNVPSGSCRISEARSTPGQVVPIAADHTFAYEEGGQLGSFFRGSFPTAGTASGTLKMTPIPAQLSCLTFASQTWTATTASRPSPQPPPQTTTGSAPYFRGGHDSVRFVRARAGKAAVTVRAKFRTCSGTPPFRLAVRQRRRVGRAVVAEVSFRRALPAGRPAPGGCRDHSVSWPLARRLFGPGFVVVTLVVVDAAGEESGGPQYALRAPRR